MCSASRNSARRRRWRESGRDQGAGEGGEGFCRRHAAGLPAQARSGLLADVPAALPALARAVKLQDKASKVGFDWNDAKLVLAKIREECDEVEEALAR